MKVYEEQAISMKRIALFLSDFLHYGEDCFDNYGFVISEELVECFEACKDSEGYYEAEKIYKILCGMLLEVAKNSGDDIGNFEVYEEVSYGRKVYPPFAEEIFNAELQLYKIEVWHYLIRSLLASYLRVTCDGLNENSQYDKLYNALWNLLHELDDFLVENQPMYSLVCRTLL